MLKVESLEEINQEVQEHRFILLLISRRNCSVCQAVRPQIEQLLSRKDLVQGIYVDADEVTEIAGAYSVFTVPAVIVLADGKEMFRKVRFIPMEELSIQLTKLLSAYTEG
ncbi:thioredoxin family protein [Virgibacillus senegalensis]|uniref:thioredoxin family protein n=1 Tax=Virgibacillus senegalensis TaxID=1499679 RepID=UPI00069EDADE|nr:thioredoxin family protein [Virgibacillus senegalensis]